MCIRDRQGIDPNPDAAIAQPDLDFTVFTLGTCPDTGQCEQQENPHKAQKDTAYDTCDFQEKQDDSPHFAILQGKLELFSFGQFGQSRQFGQARQRKGAQKAVGRAVQNRPSGHIQPARFGD